MKTLTLSPVELYLRVSAASVGASEVPPNSNAGPYVKRVLARTGNKEGDPWCASQITDWGVLALGDDWPVLKSASVQAICEWAARANCRYPARYTPPQVGDLLAVWFPSLNRWAHICVITAVNADGSVATRDGNTNDDGGREGWLVANKRRTLGAKDCLIRWTEALP